jgi:hypothetical protein
MYLVVHRRELIVTYKGVYCCEEKEYENIVAIASFSICTL